MRIVDASAITVVCLFLASACTVSGTALLNKQALRWPTNSIDRKAVGKGGSSRRRPTLLSNHSLSLRGGGGDGLLQYQDIVAKTACVFFMGQSTTAWLAPHRTCLKYGLTTSVANVACNRKLAAAYMGSAVLMYGILFQNCTINTAIGATAVVWMFEQLKARLFYEAEEIGISPIWEYIMAAAATLTGYATLWEPAYAPLASKASALWLLGCGLAYFVAPAELCKFFGMQINVIADPKKESRLHKEQVKQYNESVFLHRYMGVALLFSGIMQSVLVVTGDIFQAIGWAFGALFFVNCYSFLNSSDFKRLARSSFAVSSTFDWKKQLQKHFFPLFNLMVSLSLLLQSRANEYAV